MPNQTSDWENIQTKFIELCQLYSKSFPHLLQPKVCFEVINNKFLIKMKLFNTELCLSDATKYPELKILDLFEDAKKLIKKYVEIHDKVQVVDLEEEVGVFLSEKEDIFKEMNREDLVLPLKDKSDLPELIKSYCKKKELNYPEYSYMCSNGVYTCIAIFNKEKFSSSYMNNQLDSKVKVDSMIYNYIIEVEGLLPHKYEDSEFRPKKLNLEKFHILIKKDKKEEEKKF